MSESELIAVSEGVMRRDPTSGVKKKMRLWFSPGNVTHGFFGVGNLKLSKSELVAVSEGIMWRVPFSGVKKTFQYDIFGEGFLWGFFFPGLENESNAVVEARRRGYVARPHPWGQKNIKTEFSSGSVTNKSFGVWASEIRIIQL